MAEKYVTNTPYIYTIHISKNKIYFVSLGPTATFALPKNTAACSFASPNGPTGPAFFFPPPTSCNAPSNTFPPPYAAFGLRIRQKFTRGMDRTTGPSHGTFSPFLRCTLSELHAGPSSCTHSAGLEVLLGSGCDTDTTWHSYLEFSFFIFKVHSFFFPSEKLERKALTVVLYRP